MAAGEPAAGAAPATAPPARLDDVMLAMDVVDTLRHREQLVERELDEEARAAQLVDRLRALYRSQGIEVPDRIIADGVRALKENRFVYTPPRASLARTLALLWVKRTIWGARVGGSLAAIVVALGLYQYAVVAPRERAAVAARLELTETLPRQLAAAHQAISAEARVPDARERADAILAEGRAALDRHQVAPARAAVGDLDRLAARLRQEYVLRIAGRPEDETGFHREHAGFQGRAYFIVVDAIDPDGNPVRLAIRNDETNRTDTVSRFAVRVPMDIYQLVRADKAANGIVQNARLAEKRRGFLEPEFRMRVLEGRITRW